MEQLASCSQREGSSREDLAKSVTDEEVLLVTNDNHTMHCLTAFVFVRRAIGHGFTRQLEIDAEEVRELEFKLYQRMELYHGRIRWLNQGSKKVFGLVKGSCVGLMIDTSGANCSGGRLVGLQMNLVNLIDEQLSDRQQLYLMAFGSDSSSLWDSPSNVSPSRLQEARRWVGDLRPRGGCNLLQALKRVLDADCSQLDSLVIVLGSSPDEPTAAIMDYMERSLLGRDLPVTVHAVSYCSSHPVTVGTVRKLAEMTGGRYHIFSASLGIVASSTDVDVLWREIKAAREMLSQTERLCQGHLEDVAIMVVGQEISSTLDSLALSPPRPETANQSAPLTVKAPGVQPSTSADWLKSHGLKAKRLELQQVLSPNAYSPLEEFVPILNKTVSSTVYEKAMVQFEWHDGTVKNVHVDLPSLLSYQKQLLALVRVLERRVQWLSSGSRQTWGTVCERRVQIVVDMSAMNSACLPHIQHALRLMLEEQLANKQSFNIIAFGSAIRPWREKMVPPTPDSLREAWQWVLALRCAGSRNTLTALRQALEGTLPEEGGPQAPPLAPPLPQGVYLLTSGLPDQEMRAVCSYISGRRGNQPLNLHVCLLDGEEADVATGTGEGYPSAPRCAPPTEETARALWELAQTGGGRFHWTCETGVLESDDVTALIQEMDMAADYWQKSSVLMESLTQRAGCSCPVERPHPGARTSALTNQTWRSREGPLPPPRPTALTLARMQRESRTEGSTQRSITWRPSSARGCFPAAQPVTGWGLTGSKAKPKKDLQVSQSVFFLEDGSLGAVFKSYPQAGSVRKSIPTLTLPKKEDICSTKQWLRSYGVKKLRLDLHRLVSGPDCAHQKKLVPPVLKTVSAKYCSIFPSVHVNGKVKHLQLTPGELKQYLTQSERLLQRYTNRLCWLLSGSQRVFGTVLEKEVCILVDVSGSMAPCLEELKKELVSLIWDQLHHNHVRFSLVAFSTGVRVWRPCLQVPSEGTCRDAAHWVSQLDTHGGTDTLEALKVGCGFGSQVGLYLLSDGKPDCSCSRVLRETQRLTSGNHNTIHTVSYYCTDRVAKDFLKKLAHQTGGRYRSCQDHARIDGLLASDLRDGDQSLCLSEQDALPAIEGDDLKRLVQEINKLRVFRKQAQCFREIIMNKNQGTA
ncbi:von Willebrand factor A domain-containing protein 3A [Aplochiton taeniatus]